MQNLPDKGVSGYSYYLLAEYTVTGLTESVLESQGRSAERRETFPFWDRPITTAVTVLVVFQDLTHFGDGPPWMRLYPTPRSFVRRKLCLQFVIGVTTGGDLRHCGPRHGRAKIIAKK
jgi:hypothetical protein